MWPVYLTLKPGFPARVACEFADLHDRAGRMKAVGAVRESALAARVWRGNGWQENRLPVCWCGISFVVDTCMDRREINGLPVCWCCIFLC